MDAPDNVWAESWTLNFTAVRRLTQACLLAMQAQRWGHITTITGSSEPSGINAANPAKAAVDVWAREVKALGRREGSYSSQLTTWRRLRERGGSGRS